MIKTLFPGNEFKSDFRGGFAFVWALVLLFVVSVLPVSFLMLERMKLEEVHKKSESFHREVKKQNERLQLEWKGKFSNENN